MTYRNRTPKKSRLSAALFAALLVPASGLALAQDATTTDDDEEDVATLDKIVVTGSLIPQSQIETATPVMTITAEDISARGFTSVADALQATSFSVGGIQGSQTSASFTQGAETISLFGMGVGFTKFLIDGRPMANYPALYNGSDTFNNISGIPVELVDRIEILPGGQSSLYGSDAIAGVVNIILKKSMDGSVATLRGGWHERGGGASIRGSFATGFSSDDERFNLLFGVQTEKRDPIWGYQRDITEQYYDEGTSAPLASRDWLVYSPFTSYSWQVPDDACDAVSSGFGGTVDLQTRVGFGDEHYCGSYYSPGYRTLMNGKEAHQAYGHATFDVSDNATLYGDVLYSREIVDYHVGANFTWWGTSVEWGYFFDPDADGPDGPGAGNLLNLQRAFVPEDMGGSFENSMNHDKSESWAVTFGVEGTFGASNWDYDVGASFTNYDLDEVGFVRWAEPMNQFFQDLVLGPQLGLDPWYGAYPVFDPNYAAFYQLLTQDQFDAMTGYAVSRSNTEDNFVRAQVVNGALFELGGGDAGLAVAVEAGREDWTYTPDPGYLNGDIWGTTAVAGDGDRSRYAVTGEMRTPWTEMFTTTVSARYDSFTFDDAFGDDRTVSSPTWSVGLEFRPMDTLLLRGKYGTAFKSPTLSDLYQGLSGYYSTVVDYYQCSLLGFSYTEAPRECPSVHSSRQYFGTTSGNTELDPIEADVWTVGMVFAPFDQFSMSLDYHSWDVRDQVSSDSADFITLTEARCRNGELDITSPTCVAALAAVTRGSTGRINEIYTPKLNIAQETTKALVAAIGYGWTWDGVGDFRVRGNYTHMIEHEYLRFEGDAVIDLLDSPYWSSDPHNKADASITWSQDRWSSTLYANWIDSTPNYRSRVYDGVVEDDPLGLVDDLPSYTRWNASVSWQALDDLEFSLMINNLLDDMPPEDHSYPGTSGAPYNSAQYNVWGRAYYFEGRYSF
jgi:outer membrane receptor protein involved in Fe transport